MIEALQDKDALKVKSYKKGTEDLKAYKKGIEDLKAKLVKLDLHQMKTAKKFEKEITSARATAEHQKKSHAPVKENLRGHQQLRHTWMITEPGVSRTQSWS